MDGKIKGRYWGMDARTDVFENNSNRSSPSVLFVLREIPDSGRPQPGQKGMLLAFA